MALLATFMSKEDAETLKREGSYKKLKTEFLEIEDLGKQLGYLPIFCIQLSKESMRENLFKFIFTSCNIPQRLVIFESEDAKYLEFTNWINASAGFEKEVKVFEEDTDNYTEAIIESISYSSVLEIIDISDGVEEVCQDESWDFIYSDELVGVLRKYVDDEAYLIDIGDTDVCVQTKFLDYFIKLNTGTYKVSEDFVKEFKEFIFKELII